MIDQHSIMNHQSTAIIGDKNQSIQSILPDLEQPFEANSKIVVNDLGARQSDDSECRHRHLCVPE